MVFQVGGDGAGMAMLSLSQITMRPSLPLCLVHLGC
jgi:hypothetical protein